MEEEYQQGFRVVSNKEGSLIIMEQTRQNGPSKHLQKRRTSPVPPGKLGRKPLSQTQKCIHSKESAARLVTSALSFLNQRVEVALKVSD